MIFIVYGTRAELIKFSPIIRELRRRHVPFKTVDTGQHDNESLQKKLNLPKPDFHLGTSYRSRWSGLESSIATYPMASLLALVWGFKVFVKLTRILSAGDVIVTHGNAMGVPLAIYAAKLSSRRPTIVHMESGFRGGTGNARLLDFIYRFADKRSDYLFTPYKSTRGNLERDDVKGKIILSGDVMTDVVKDTLKIRSTIKAPKGKFVLANLTRSIVSKEDGEAILTALSKSPIDVVLIMNPVIRERIEKFDLSHLVSSRRIRLMRTLDYPDFLHMLGASAGAITDSTGVQEECAVLGKPCIVTNNFMQIPELLRSGTVFKSGANYDRIISSLEKIAAGKWKPRKTNVEKESPTKIIVENLMKLEADPR